MDEYVSSKDKLVAGGKFEIPPVVATKIPAKTVGKKEKVDPSIAKHKAFLAKQAALAKKIDNLYTEGEWLTYVNYECKRCPYSSVSEDSIREHVRKHL